MSHSLWSGRAGRPRWVARLLAVATTSLLASAALAHADVRTGTAGPGTMNPPIAANRLLGGLVSYDSTGKLATSIRLAGDPRGEGAIPNSVIVYVGTWRGGRCDAVPGTPAGSVGGLPNTFNLPPYPDPTFFYLTQVKLASLGENTLDPTAVTVSAAGGDLSMTATTPAFADKAWNCAYVTVGDHSAEGEARGFPAVDRTAVFPVVAAGAGVTVPGRSLAARRGRVALRLANGAAATSGTITIRAGGVTLVRRAPYRLGMLTSTRVSPRLTRAGRALLRERGRVRATVTIIAEAVKGTTATVTVRG